MRPLKVAKPKPLTTRKREFLYYLILTAMTPQRTKRIVVAFRLAGEPGRRKLGGFLRYITEHELDWDLQFVRIREEFSSEFVSALADRNIDGIIYSMPSAKDGAAELSKLDIPTIALDTRATIYPILPTGSGGFQSRLRFSPPLTTVRFRCWRPATRQRSPFPGMSPSSVSIMMKCSAPTRRLR